MTTVRTRREPPRFRVVEVVGVEERSPRLVRVTLAGPELEGFDAGLPAASVRLFLPPPGSTEVVLPTWNGNEFLTEEGERPVIRTLTPLEFDPDRLALDVEIVRHGHGPLSGWASHARIGDRVAVSGPGRGYAIDDSVRAFLLAGDESALPAIGQLLGVLPEEAEVRVEVEIGHPSAEIELPPHPRATVGWRVLRDGLAPGDTLVRAVADAPLLPEVRVWAAGEAAAMQRIRRYLFEERDLPRRHAVVRGYWKLGRGGDADAAVDE
jgi:NADPH-dependent ferric siderophore reductase